MELTAGSTLSLKGAILPSAEATLGPDRQIDEVAVEKSSLMSAFGEAIQGGIIGSIIGIAGGGFAEAMISLPPEAIVASLIGFSYFGSVGIFAQGSKYDFYDETAKTLEFENKTDKKKFIKALKKLGKDDEVILVSEPDSQGNVKVWKLSKTKLTLRGIRNSDEDWDRTLNNIKDVYSLSENTAGSLVLSK